MTPLFVLVAASGASARQRLRESLPAGVPFRQEPLENIGVAIHDSAPDLVLASTANVAEARVLLAAVTEEAEREPPSAVVLSVPDCDAAADALGGGAFDAFLESDPRLVAEVRVARCLELLEVRRRDVGHGLERDARAATATEAGRKQVDLEAVVAARTSELATALRALDARRRFIETVLDTLMSGVVAVDDTGVVILANRAALAVLEVPQASSVGSSIRSFFGEAPELFATFRTMTRTQKGSERRLELTYTAPSGRKVDIGMAVISVDNTGLSGQFPRLTLQDDDRPVQRRVEPSRSSLRFLLVFRDLSVKHQSALEMRRVWALAAVGEMAAGFAHEIRNPVAAIRSLCDLLLADTPEGDARREYVTRIEALLVRMERLVRTSLRFAQPTAPARRACDPRNIVEEALEVLSPRWRGSGDRPAFVAPAQLPSLRVDPDQIVEVLVALLDNAFDAVGHPDRIAIRVEPASQGDVLPEGTFLALEVVDDGPGIPGDVQAQVFDPFFTTKPKGTGLGLSIVQRLVRQNEGHLRLFSQPGETRFRILLPVDSAQPETP